MDNRDLAASILFCSVASRRFVYIGTGRVGWGVGVMNELVKGNKEVMWVVGGGGILKGRW